MPTCRCAADDVSHFDWALEVISGHVQMSFEYMQFYTVVFCVGYSISLCAGPSPGLFRAVLSIVSSLFLSCGVKNVGIAFDLFRSHRSTLLH